MRKEFSKRTKLLAFQRSGGRCEKCSARLGPGNTKYEFHHDKEATFGGTNDLANCIVLCRTCHSKLTGVRAGVIAKSNRQRAKHIGLRCRQGRSSFAANRDRPFKKKLSGEVVRR